MACITASHPASVCTEQWSITLLGEGGVGKTALAMMYDLGIEDAFRHSVVVDDEAAYLDIIDTTGQEEFAALRDQWIRGSDGIILVYSISSRSSFERMTTYHDSVVRVKRGGQPTFMIVGNKSDKEQEREVSRAEAEALGRQWGCPWMEASAKTAVNVERTFSDTIRALRARRDGDTRRRSQGAAGVSGGSGGGGGRQTQPQLQAQYVRGQGRLVEDSCLSNSLPTPARTEPMRAAGAGVLPTDLPQGSTLVDPLPSPSGRLRQEALVMFSNLFGSSREKDKRKGQERELDRGHSLPADDSDRTLWGVSRLIGSCLRRVPFRYSYALNLHRLLY
ncbi:ras-domain-containing protein [Ceratobasidium sp. AG-I]|nr:ras-domain-containing protein [Ceratobasidium sp. AG-I]